MNKISRAIFHIFSKEAIWPKEFSKSMQGFKSAILETFQRGRDRPSKKPSKDFKNHLNS